MVPIHAAPKPSRSARNGTKVRKRPLPSISNATPPSRAPIGANSDMGLAKSAVIRIKGPIPRGWAFGETGRDPRH